MIVVEKVKDFGGKSFWVKNVRSKYKRNNYFKNFLPYSASSLLKKQFTVKSQLHFKSPLSDLCIHL